MSTHLPLELLHIIFLQAAESSTSSCCTLCAVSSWDCFYRPEPHQTPRIVCPIDNLGPLTCPPSPTFCPADTLRHLWAGFDSNSLESIVQQCKNITHLAICARSLVELIDIYPKRRGRVYTAMSDLHVVLIQNFTYRAGRLQPVGENPLFTRITHLRLEDTLVLAPLQLVADMPRLTHLAIPWPRNHNRIPGGASVSGTSIEVVVVILKRWDKSERQVIEDLIRQQDSLEKEWDAEVEVVQRYGKGRLNFRHKIKEEQEAEARSGAIIWERVSGYNRLVTINKPLVEITSYWRIQIVGSGQMIFWSRRQGVLLQRSALEAV
ncbi:hypothetical protein BD779DRAFT_1479135 [Infundibulicybe gibba]|nr:hypothetical protein BD779DRAFT_1479135 [Infundibulicybe gibba]